MADTLTNRVRRGARLLDERYGRGWRRRVKLRRLNLGSGCNCVLGQLEGGYHRGLEALDFDQRQSAHHGFNVSVEEGAREAEVYERLTDLWADEIRTRRKARA